MNKKTNKLKKIVSLILTFCFIFLTSACTPKNENVDENIQTQNYSNEIKKFLNLISSGNYNDALEYYVENIALNVVLEEEAKTACINYYETVNKKYLDGTIDKSTADMEYAKLKKVMDNIHTMTFVSEYESELANINQSKDNYELGVAAYENDNYIAAIEYLNKVLINDCNFEDAQSKLAESKEKYKKSVLTDAENKVAEDKYPQALKALNDAISVLGSNTEIKAKIDEYGNTYIKNEITKAEEAFVDPKTDWETALNIIKAAQQYMPDNEDLNNKCDYYMSFMPIDLMTLEPYKRTADSFEFSTNVPDNRGNTYSNALIASFNTNHKPIYGIYALDKKYNNLSFTCAISSIADSEKYSYIKVYGDDKILYEYDKFKLSSQAFDVNVDITGVSDLKIEYYCDYSVGSINFFALHFLIANAKLQRTVK